MTVIDSRSLSRHLETKLEEEAMAGRVSVEHFPQLDDIPV
jgi:hypothetical protein